MELVVLIKGENKYWRYHISVTFNQGETKQRRPCKSHVSPLSIWDKDISMRSTQIHFNAVWGNTLSSKSNTYHTNKSVKVIKEIQLPTTKSVLLCLLLKRRISQKINEFNSIQLNFICITLNHHYSLKGLNRPNICDTPLYPCPHTGKKKLPWISKEEILRNAV